MFSRIWQENKRFILIAGSGLAVFLLLNSFVSGYLSRADAVIRKGSQLEKESRSLLKELRGYWDEKSRLADYEKHEAQLRSELELPPEKELEKIDKAAPLIQFNQAVDRAWGQAKEKANQAGVAIPEKLGPQDFGVERGDTEKEYERHYAYLGVIRRGLQALIEAGITEIGRPELIPEEMMPVLPDDNGAFCLLRSVRFRVSGTYDSFLRTLKSLQASQSFLQVNIGTLTASRPGEERMLKGDIELTAIRIVEGSEAALQEKEKASAKPQNRPKRGKR